MPLSLRIALRYLFSKKSTNAINIISAVSVTGMAVGAFALIVILSVFNGFENLVGTLYNSFYPELEVRVVQGRTFVRDSVMEQKLRALKDVEQLTASLEEQAYFEYAGQSSIGMVKGVQTDYCRVNRIDTFVREGTFSIQPQKATAVIGANIALGLGVNIDAPFEWISITVPVSENGSGLLPTDGFRAMNAKPAGIFSIQQEFDSKYVFVPLEMLQQLSGDEQLLSAYELKLKDGAEVEVVRVAIRSICGENFSVKTRYEQKEFIYRMMKIERWAVMAILSFILFIVSFNIIGSLSMLVMEKKQDVAILKAMGATQSMVRGIFHAEGLLQGLLGAAIGLLVGGGLCWLQLRYGFVKLGGADSTFVVQSYPVKMRLLDFSNVLLIVVGICLLASYVPAKRAAESAIELK